MVVLRCGRYNLDVKIVSGSHVGDIVCLPRINLTCNESKTFSLKFVRRQFPVKVAYCITINKSQGQTFNRALVVMPTPVFAHGQLYVALSRVGTPEGLRVAGNFDSEGRSIEYVARADNIVRNVVWTEVL
jgi:hypothetical protein